MFFSAFLPLDWLVILLTILAVVTILLVCAAVAKRKRYGLLLFHFSYKPEGKMKQSHLPLLLQLVWQKSDPDDHVKGRRGERSRGVSVQFPRTGEGAGNGDPHEQGEDPGERQHGGVHRHQAGGDSR